MKHPRIWAEIQRNHWAITEPALDGILRALEYDLEPADYAYFHGVQVAQREALAAELGERTEETIYTYRNGDLGMIMIEGPIIPRSSEITDSSGIASIEALTREFKALEQDEEIKTIALLVDSPGGSVTGGSDFAALVKASKKKTVSFVIGSALSLAYWIVSATDRIVSTDTGMVGAIGTILKIDTNDDGKVVIVSTQSPLKNPDPSTAAGRKSLQGVSDDLAAVFIDKVALYMGVSRDEVLSNFGQGAPVVAARALEAGMIHEIKTLSQTLQELKNGANIGTDLDRTGLGAEQGQNHVLDLAGTQEGNMKTLAELLAEYPWLAAEIAQIKATARTEGYQAGQNEIQARIETAQPFLAAGSTYGKAGQELAVKVLTGKADPMALQTVATVLDAQREEAAAADAENEVEDQDDLEAEPPEGGGSEEMGEKEFRASVDSDRIRRGLAPLYGVEVQS